MPKKSSAKKHPSRAANDSVKHDIASAVNQIPGLIYESMKEEYHTAPHTVSPKPAAPLPRDSEPSGLTIRMYRERQAKGQAAKKKLLIMGVICITLVIITMWAWNMRIFWYRTQELTKEEPGLWDDSRENLLDVLNKAKEEENSLKQLMQTIEQQEIKKDDSEQAFANAVSSLLSTTTSTPTTTPSSTIIYPTN